MHQHQRKRSQGEHHDEIVEQAGAAHHDAETVQRHEQAGNQRNRQIVEQAQGHAGDQHDGDDTGNGNARTPGDGIVGAAEQFQPGRDHPLADRRMHHIFGRIKPTVGVTGCEQSVDFDIHAVDGHQFRPIARLAGVQHGPRVFDVIRFVEYHRTRGAKSHKAQDSAESGHKNRHQPCERPRGGPTWFRRGIGAVTLMPPSSECGVSRIRLDRLYTHRRLISPARHALGYTVGDTGRYGEHTSAINTRANRIHGRDG